MDTSELAELFGWSEETWLARTEGSAMRRIGFKRWLRNIAVALGNAQSSPDVLEALRARSDSGDELINEHVQWALQQHESRSKDNNRD
jgi:epoxyqueuosine reductase